MRTALFRANYAYLVPAIAIYFVSLYFRAFRWRYLLRPFVRSRTNRLYPVLLVGYMANNVLPMRLGELVRSYYLSLREPVRGSTALATIVIERVFDGLTMLFLLVVTAFFLPVAGLAAHVSNSIGIPEWSLGLVVVVPFAAVLGTMIAIALHPETSQRIALRLSQRLPERVGMRAYGLAERFLDGFEGLHRPERLVTVFLLSIPVWLVEAIMYYIVAQAFGLQHQLGGPGPTMAAMLVVTSVANLATSIPSSQGSVGPFEFFAAIVLEFLGVNSGTASAYALVLHAALLLPVIAGGLLYLASQSLSLGQLARVPRRPEPVAAVASPEAGEPEPPQEELS